MQPTLAAALPPVVSTTRMASLLRCRRALMCHLRPGENIEEEVKDILLPEEVKALAASTHRPNYVMQARRSCRVAWRARCPALRGAKAVGTARSRLFCVCRC